MLLLLLCVRKQISWSSLINYLVESEAGRADFHREVARDVGRGPARRTGFREEHTRIRGRIRISYHSLACRVMRLRRNVLFPEMLCFSSVTVATPISLSLSLSQSMLCLCLTFVRCALHLGLDDSSRCESLVAFQDGQWRVCGVGVRAESYENQQSET
jgi:hypothetical protein